MPHFTVFVQEADGRGTTHVTCHECDTIEEAIRAGVDETIDDWDSTEDKVRVLGVIAGEARILEWSDCDYDAPIAIPPAAEG